MINMNAIERKKEPRRRSVVVGDKTWLKLKTLAGEQERSMAGMVLEALQMLFKRYNVK